METKFTQGPWVAEHRATRSMLQNGEDFYAIRRTEDIGDIEAVSIAHAFPWNSVGRNHKANAHLIAAAPELYHALKLLQTQALQSTVMDGNDWGREALEYTQLALAKALGEQCPSNNKQTEENDRRKTCLN
ncbi:MAG: hypothetical protein COB36_11470 [Alphaproteobacteria bacterium]|nr:MAG: hypothetical protein COB36_11470 [Alphaproteobacteria bacterium]